MTRPGIRALSAEEVGTLYDALHLAWAAARKDYTDTTDPLPEEHARGRRDGLDEAISILDEWMDK